MHGCGNSSPDALFLQRHSRFQEATMIRMHGIPIFRQNKAFMVFVISDVIEAFTVFVISDVVALVMSITSILSSLSIFISRYAEEDFLVNLPFKLMLGFSTLVVSVASMSVAFSATFFLVYDKAETKLPWVIAVFLFEKT
ncbi:ankyrin repeat-containing protein [Cucumis melo var. makuwa]|uniref:Ankyrin repeat-containing protein n=1 Tax=Cucumis melo var. makuwa TaxID=1194695 RepID=A0A5D3BJ69_CUCMM|nr:ankyrin repeat-containing protein [Cucumis melo var. makuwa]